MISLLLQPIVHVGDARKMLQTAIGVEFGTLPPYLSASFSIPPGSNPEALARIRAIQGQEMIHFCLACNILNALGGDPLLTPPVYPGPLPGDIGRDGEILTVHLLPFGKDAMQQGMSIEEPATPIVFPDLETLAFTSAPKTVTIGQFYTALDTFLATLPSTEWSSDRHQIEDDQFFQGQLFPVGSYEDAHRAIIDIISEGEGAADHPLDFQGDVAHYYRFEEIFRDQLLTQDSAAPSGFGWGAPLGVDWTAVYPAIADPGSHDFSIEPAAAQAAQHACNEAYSEMIDALQLAVTGHPAQLGVAIRAMFALRMAAMAALQVPLSDGTKVAGAAFLYVPIDHRGATS